MSSINSGAGQLPIVSSVSGIPSSEKNSSSEKTAKADQGAANAVENANAETQGLTGSEKSHDRDADGRQLDQPAEHSDPSTPVETKDAESSAPVRSQDPEKKRGTHLDVDA